MPLNRPIVVHPLVSEPEGSAYFFRARFRSFEIPAVRDAIVVGRKAPVVFSALLETLKLVSTDSFTALPVEDEIIAALIVRDALLKKLPWQTIVNFVQQRMKPFMSSSEILRLDLDLEIMLDVSL